MKKLTRTRLVAEVAKAAQSAFKHYTGKELSAEQARHTEQAIDAILPIRLTVTNDKPYRAKYEKPVEATEPTEPTVATPEPFIPAPGEVLHVENEPEIPLPTDPVADFGTQPQEALAG